MQRLAPTLLLSIALTSVACGGPSPASVSPGTDEGTFEIAPRGPHPSTAGAPEFTTSVSIVVEPSDDAKGLIAAIDGATRSVHVEMYLLTNESVIDALTSRARAGVDVAVVLNERFLFGAERANPNARAYQALTEARARVVWAPRAFDCTHEKAVVVDGKTAWIMTMNAAYTSPKHNREYLAIDTDPDDVAETEAIFEHDFANTPFEPRGRLVVSPVNARAELAALIEMARTSIAMEAEELTDPGIVSALEEAARRGVRVSVVMAAASSTRQGDALEAAGVRLAVLDTYYVHAKSIVVDDKYAYVGSVNFSTASLDHNRELGLLTDASSEVQKVSTTTEQDFESSRPL